MVFFFEREWCAGGGSTPSPSCRLFSIAALNAAHRSRATSREKMGGQTVLNESPLHRLRAAGALCGSVEDAGTSTWKDSMYKVAVAEGETLHGDETPPFCPAVFVFYL